VVTWIADDAFSLDGTTFVCRPVARRFRSSADEFCLLKARWEVEWYEDFLAARAPRRIVEIGTHEGASAALFAELAHPERLVTVDHRTEPLAALDAFVARRDLRDVVHAYRDVDQSDQARVVEIVAAEFAGAPLDLVVDDGAHLVEPTRAAFNVLFPRLSTDGGAYVIEDWSWAHSGLGDLEGWADKRPLTTFVFELVLATAHVPGILKGLYIGKNYVVVERGPDAVDPSSFDVSQCYGPRGAALLADG
jgi:hypothetical protein